MYKLLGVESLYEFHVNYTKSLVNATFGSGKKSLVLTLKDGALGKSSLGEMKFVFSDFSFKSSISCKT